MQCTNCEAQLNATAKFCLNCGHPVNSETGKNTSKAPIQNKYETQEAAGKIDTNQIAQYFIGYGNFFKQTLIHPSSVFNLPQNNWVFGLVNLIILAMLNAWMFEFDFLRNSFLQFIPIAGILGGLFLINQFLLKRGASFLDIMKDYGGLMSLQIILMLVLKLLAPDIRVDNIFSLISPGSGLGLFIFIAAIASLHILLAVNYYVLTGLKDSKLKFNPYYQLVAANMIYFTVNYVVGQIIAN